MRDLRGDKLFSSLLRGFAMPCSLLSAELRQAVPPVSLPVPSYSSIAKNTWARSWACARQGEGSRSWSTDSVDTQSTLKKFYGTLSWDITPCFSRVWATANLIASMAAQHATRRRVRFEREA